MIICWFKQVRTQLTKINDNNNIIIFTIILYIYETLKYIFRKVHCTISQMRINTV